MFNNTPAQKHNVASECVFNECVVCTCVQPQDEQEKFDRLQMDLLMNNPDSAAFYNAQMRTHRRVSGWTFIFIIIIIFILFLILFFLFFFLFIYIGVGHSSEVERSLVVWWVVGSILHGVDPLSYFSFQPVLNNWCNKGRSMCYPVCGMVHIKESLLLIGKSSSCGGNGFPLSLSEWSFTIRLKPYNRK